MSGGFENILLHMRRIVFFCVQNSKLYFGCFSCFFFFYFSEEFHLIFTFLGYPFFLKDLRRQAEWEWRTKYIKTLVPICKTGTVLYPRKLDFRRWKRQLLFYILVPYDFVFITFHQPNQPTQNANQFSIPLTFALPKYVISTPQLDEYTTFPQIESLCRLQCIYYGYVGLFIAYCMSDRLPNFSPSYVEHEQTYLLKTTLLPSDHQTKAYTKVLVGWLGRCGLSQISSTFIASSFFAMIKLFCKRRTELGN